VLDALLFLLGLLGFASTWRFWAGTSAAAIPLSVWNLVLPRLATPWWLAISIVVLGVTAGGLWQSRHERRMGRRPFSRR
jgi:hypothetical protein